MIYTSLLGPAAIVGSKSLFVILNSLHRTVACNIPRGSNLKRKKTRLFLGMCVLSLSLFEFVQEFSVT